MMKEMINYKPIIVFLLNVNLSVQKSQWWEIFLISFHGFEVQKTVRRFVVYMGQKKFLRRNSNEFWGNFVISKQKFNLSLQPDKNLENKLYLFIPSLSQEQRWM